jgi:hypothetical protein
MPCDSLALPNPPSSKPWPQAGAFALRQTDGTLRRPNDDARLPRRQYFCARPLIPLVTTFDNSSPLVHRPDIPTFKSDLGMDQIVGRGAMLKARLVTIAVGVVLLGASPATADETWNYVGNTFDPTTVIFTPNVQPAVFDTTFLGDHGPFRPPPAQLPALACSRILRSVCSA